MSVSYQPTYKTIVISDLHLGSKGAKAKEINEFLKAYSCHQLILNGDIIDGWQLKKGGEWKKKHTGFFRAVLKMMDRWDTEVIYLRGNHDDFLDQIIPLKIGKQFSIRRDYTLKSFGKKYFITHGDIFDSITSQMKWLAYLGDIGYTFLLWVNKWYNYHRQRQGKPYYSLSQTIKQKVKAAVNFISDFEEKLVELAIAQEADGIICGHIHKAEIKQIKGISYMNSGDWVESLSALVETHQGEWLLLQYPDFDLKSELKEILHDQMTL
ncbi:UDP-2,3-diacylglucosamine diphosphatase [Aquirufa sp. OSTEICH-129A]